MADVFISYKAERRRAARHLSKILTAHGYSVWYDYGLIPGEDFEPRLMAEIGASKVVVVLWCTMSVASPWVGREARIARQTGKFLPCWIETARLPDEFAGADTVNLTTWDGAPRSHVLDRLMDDIARRAGRDPTINYRALRDIDEDWRDFGAPSLAQFALSEAPTPVREPVRQPEALRPQLPPALGVAPSGLSPNIAEHWEKARENDGASLFHVAWAYDSGTGGLAQDQREAVRLYRISSDQGYPGGQTNLGYAYRNALGGLERNDAEALRLYRLAAGQGYATAQRNLGGMYRDGLGGLPQDDLEAVRYYKLAADQGDAGGQANLGWMYAHGRGGLAKDDDEAVRLYKLSAQQGEEWAQTELKRRGLTW